MTVDAAGQYAQILDILVAKQALSERDQTAGCWL